VRRALYRIQSDGTRATTVPHPRQQIADATHDLVQRRAMTLQAQVKGQTAEDT